MSRAHLVITIKCLLVLIILIVWLGLLEGCFPPLTAGPFPSTHLQTWATPQGQCPKLCPKAFYLKAEITKTIILEPAQKNSQIPNHDACVPDPLWTIVTFVHLKLIVGSCIWTTFHTSNYNRGNYGKGNVQHTHTADITQHLDNLAVHQAPGDPVGAALEPTQHSLNP